MIDLHCFFRKNLNVKRISIGHNFWLFVSNPYISNLWKFKVSRGSFKFVKISKNNKNIINISSCFGFTAFHGEVNSF